MISDLAEGDYVITEAEPANGTSLSGIERGDRSNSTGENDSQSPVDLEQRKVTVHVTAGDTAAAKGSAQAAFTNNIDYTREVDVDVIKVEQASNPVKYLSGATFQLRQIADAEPTDAGTYKDADPNPIKQSYTSGEDGKVTFSDLVHGYYELTETIAPSGYVLTGDTAVYFKVDDYGVRWLNKGSGKPSEWGGPGSNTMITFEAAQAAVEDDPETEEDESRDAANATFTIGNTPGTQLPETGGIGTALFTVIGTALSATAGAALMLQRKKHKPDRKGL